MRTVQMGSALPETAPRIVAVLASAALSFCQQGVLFLSLAYSKRDEVLHTRMFDASNLEQRADGTRKVKHAISGDSYPLWIDGGGAGDGP